MLDGRLISLASPLDRLLATPTKATQKSPHVVGVITNAEVPLGDFGDTSGSPHLAGVAALCRAGQQDSRKLLALAGFQAYWAAGDGLGFEPFFALLLKRFLPGVDRATGASNLAGNPQRTMAGSQQVKGVKTPVLQLRWTAHWS